MRWWALGFIALLPLGCSRVWYHRDADRETYAAICEKLDDPRWALPRIDIEPSPQSRLFDPTNPDYPPRPPDDPAAHQFMICADGHRGWPYWDRNGVLGSIENPDWRSQLPLGPDGVLKLTPDAAVILAQINSRQFQTQLEDVYLAALALTLERFQFALQWFLTNNTNFTHFGTGGFPTETNSLATTSRLGFTRAFTWGGQMLVDLANTFTWEYTGKTNTVSTNLGITILQPLLRNAGRQVNMEGLTQSERNLLYAIRLFARFRKQFYFQIAVEQYLTLLEVKQRIRNQEANVKTLEQNYRLMEALTAAGQASSVQEDQAFTNYQQAKIALIQARTNYQNQLDAYKLLLGLPPDLPIELDDSTLRPFELVSPALQAHQEKVSEFTNTVSRRDPPAAVEVLRSEYGALIGLTATAEALAREVQAEAQRLAERQRARPPQAGEEGRRFALAVEKLNRQAAETLADLAKLKQSLSAMAMRVVEANRTQSQNDLWVTSRDLSNLVSQLFVIQTQARVYLLELPELNLDSRAAVAMAINNRLDLMNQQAQVTDAWRGVEVAANALQGVLTATGGANLATAADANNPFAFSARGSSYNVGLLWETPLNRQVERNIYRQSLINYQRARRAYMAAEDTIVANIRQEVRQLETDRLNFEINRQALIASARQVEETQFKLLFADKSSTPVDAINILNALDRLLEAQNALINQWFSYERGRMRLLLDTEQLQLDDLGLYRDGSRTAAPAADGELIPPPKP
jgi:outer membrane protein TolC